MVNLTVDLSEDNNRKLRYGGHIHGKGDFKRIINEALADWLMKQEAQKQTPADAIRELNMGDLEQTQNAV